MHYGTVTFMFEGSEDDVQSTSERIQRVIDESEIDCNVTEDIWDDETT